ncbi:MAG TPA: hypothetical protein VI299_23020, partial [Polyangiales bacterium]
MPSISARLVALTLSSTVVASLGPSTASACSGFLTCRKLGAVQPADQASNVPRNVELRIMYTQSYTFEEGASAVLETEDGQVVPTTWERAQLGSASAGPTQQWMGRPTSVLAPATHYRIRHSYHACTETDAGTGSPSETCGGLCKTALGDVISEFTTGADVAEETLAPPMLGAPVLLGSEATPDSQSCGPYSRCLYSVGVPTLANGQQLRVMKDSELLGYFETEHELRIAVHRPGSNGYGVGVDLSLSQGTELQVSVVDAIGNRSAATTLTIPMCAPESDGGVRTLDAGLSREDGGSHVQPDAMAGLDS